uniref:Uncharacterized protein n=1 Tax=Chromera velia CCMP2878 TaxID=1169474 RepID=A0A0G4GZK3_9ALVE|eukprot:Cvel_23994.t1-p1 / transcript=Cvel_23994.t1 / gene=Cvel_23994 / organism=Chromera_velia_CCMP2878 / gene_product=hypothetical protein / transcript_product=hypothetical protein / location=Cvel_scaffold2543:12519-13567(-) / protein_length=189 / sequence_SO=supercontig / SO=protein_coding / is_pseudo=false
MGHALFEDEIFDEYTEDQQGGESGKPGDSGGGGDGKRKERGDGNEEGGDDSGSFDVGDDVQPKDEGPGDKRWSSGQKSGKQNEQGGCAAGASECFPSESVPVEVSAVEGIGYQLPSPCFNFLSRASISGHATPGGICGDETCDIDALQTHVEPSEVLGERRRRLDHEWERLDRSPLQNPELPRAEGAFP